jgi:DNA-binding NarL/FixJ family response regulator
MRIVLAAGQVAERRALGNALEQDPEMRIVSEAATAVDLLAQADERQPDLVLMACDLPGFEAVDPVVGLHALCPAMKVIVFGTDPNACKRALDAGANAFVAKKEPLQRMLQTLRSVAGLSPVHV